MDKDNNVKKTEQQTSSGVQIMATDNAGKSQNKKSVLKLVNVKKEKDKEVQRHKIKATGRKQSTDDGNFGLTESLVENDADDDLSGPLYLQEEVEVDTSSMSTDIAEVSCGTSSVSEKYSKICSSIDLDHSFYSGNLAAGESRLNSLLVDKHYESFDALSCEKDDKPEDVVDSGVSQFPAQGAFPESGNDVTEGENLLEFVSAEDPVGKGEQIVVLDEEGDDLGILSQFGGDSVQTVIVGDYEYGSEVIVDQC